MQGLPLTSSSTPEIYHCQTDSSQASREKLCKAKGSITKMIDKTFNQVKIKPKMILCHLSFYFIQSHQGLASYTAEISLSSRRSILTTTSDGAFYRQQGNNMQDTQQDKFSSERKVNALKGRIIVKITKPLWPKTNKEKI